MGILSKALETFWSPSVWLPPNVTWADIEPGSNPEIDYADYRDLIWPIPLAFVILAIRHIFEV